MIARESLRLRRRSNDLLSLGESVRSIFDLDEQEADDEMDEVRRLAITETRQVRLWRLLVVGLILITGASLSIGTYIYLDRNNDDECSTNYLRLVNTIEDSTEFHVRSIFQAIKGLGDAITVQAQQTGQQFPYVTIPSFEILAQHARAESGVEVIYIVPRVLNKTAWIQYSLENQGWIEESRRIASVSGDKTFSLSNYKNESIPADIISVQGPRDPPYGPLWQMSPPPFSPSKSLNIDIYSFGTTTGLEKAIEHPADVFTPVREYLQSMIGTAISFENHEAYHSQFVYKVNKSDTSSLRPHSIYSAPVFTKLEGEEGREVGAFFSAIVAWDRYFSSLIPANVSGIVAVLENDCNQSFTYKLDGNKAYYLGKGDLHDPKYDFSKREISFGEGIVSNGIPEYGSCNYVIDVYSSGEFQESCKSSIPVIFTSCVAAVFAFMAVVFFVYDKHVQQRNEKVVGVAARSNAVISSLFPSNVREQILDQAQERTRHNRRHTRLQSFLDHRSVDSADSDDEETDIFKTKPIADLFAETTVLFADIVGFTAWSSTREPTQVFMLLESLYRSFDQIAKRRHVFKVETVGDCYVAVTGLPEPRRDHATLMARFARDCVEKMQETTKKLEVLLGPDTSELTLRVGVHSGPVTAGVLRGEKSRFQLFGDTMNTAARMESTSLPGRIQMSQETAELLLAQGHQQWIELREGKIVAKGKGELQTYWLNMTDRSTDTANSATDSTKLDDRERSFRDMTLLNGKTARLIDWNIEILSRLLKQIVARRKAVRGRCSTLSVAESTSTVAPTSILDEVKEVIALPQFDPNAARKQEEAETIQLDSDVDSQLRDYVVNIAIMYKDNPFHNFEHASHVTMSVVKLLSRIVAPAESDGFSSEDVKKKTKRASVLHDSTFGITSDPLTQFACVFSALIHDVDHPGVPNATLVKEKTKMAMFYKGRSIAEQNSVDLAWGMLMDERYQELYNTICHCDSERDRFRQLIVNSVMATDIIDEDLKKVRNARWTKAFSAPENEERSPEVVNRKATIVIEHLIQASDVAHTMQHWHIYRKWNECYFRECYKAYKEGRAEKDPADDWYQGEIGFFDHYIIPLAKKLKECGVFGVSSDEYLNYALKNRNEWQDRGHECVREMVSKCCELQEGGSRVNDEIHLEMEQPGDKLLDEHIYEDSVEGASTPLQDNVCKSPLNAFPNDEANFQNDAKASLFFI